MLVRVIPFIKQTHFTLQSRQTTTGMTLFLFIADQLVNYNICVCKSTNYILCYFIKFIVAVDFSFSFF